MVVCGAGPAGIAAAISAARTQRNLGISPDVRLIETHGQLGGVWTSGLLSWVLDANNKSGLLTEIVEAAEQYRIEHGGRKGPPWGRMYDPEHMKVLLETLCLEAGVRVRLHTSVVAAQTLGGRLTRIITESKSGREAFEAKCFIDCTGDGDLAARAGCAFEFGQPDPDNPGSVRCQPMTLLGLVTGVDPEQIARFSDRTRYSTPEVKAAVLGEFRRAGVTPSNSSSIFLPILPDLYGLGANHEYGRDPHNAQDITDATMAARRELHQLVNALRSLGEPWSNLRLVMTAEQIGIRESRRIAGRYQVTLDDAVAGRRHDDAVCECTFGIDVHATSAGKDGSGGIEAKPVSKTQPYDIPYRALVARDLDGLLMAGRCISGDFYAHSSYRVTGNSVPTGEAAGCAAAIAAARGVSPSSLDYPRDVRPLLQSLYAGHGVTQQK